MLPVASSLLSRIRERADPPAKNFLKSGPVSAIGIGPEALVLVVRKSLNCVSIRRNRRSREHTRTSRTRCVCFAICVCAYTRETYVRVYTHTYMYIFIYRYIFGYFFLLVLVQRKRESLFFLSSEETAVFESMEKTRLFSCFLRKF